MNTPIGIRNPYDIFHVFFKSLYSNIIFLKDDNGNAATLLFCDIPNIVPYIEYIKARVVSFPLYLLIM